MQCTCHCFNALLGKDYTLLHQAPIVAVFILDHVGLPLASLYEVDNQIVPRELLMQPHPFLSANLVIAPVQTAPHFVVMVTEEQIKVICLTYALIKLWGLVDSTATINEDKEEGKDQ